MRAHFQFKQFSVYQDLSAMKVGTDAVLLGAWAPISHAPDSILDIGSGTGVIALILAQRSPANLIDAVEIEDQAYIQSVENFENSPWADRLFCYHADFVEFYSEMDEKYELIVSNPPYFEQPNGTIPTTDQRQKARFTSSLAFDSLLKGAAKLLAKTGKFALILPFSQEQTILELAEKQGLHLQKLTRVKGHANSSIKRSLMAFGFDQTNVTPQELIVEESRHQYTPAYRDLTKAFYLNME